MMLSQVVSAEARERSEFEYINNVQDLYDLEKLLIRLSFLFKAIASLELLLLISYIVEYNEFPDSQLDKCLGIFVMLGFYCFEF